MSLTFALALAAGPGLASAQPAMKTFDKVCSAATSIDDAAVRATADGWTEFEPEKQSPLGYVVGITRAVGGPKGDKPFRRDGDALFVWARETIPAPMGQFVECKVFDFSVSEMPSNENLIAWAGRRPDQSMDLSDGKLRMWFDGDDKSTSISIQTPPCFRNPCEKPRLVIERSILKNN